MEYSTCLYTPVCSLYVRLHENYTVYEIITRRRLLVNVALQYCANPGVHVVLYVKIQAMHTCIFLILWFL